MKSKAEEKYIAMMDEQRENVVSYNEYSVTEGFEYFDSKEYVKPNKKPKDFNFEQIADGFQMMTKSMPLMQRSSTATKKSFEEIAPYINDLESKKDYSHLDSGKVCQDLKEYAYDTHKVLVGFTPVPNELVFKRKSVLFPYAIVCLHEMDKEPINQAPKATCQIEVARVYAVLGEAVNDIARWLRETYGIRCQSNHPLGGSTDITPLAKLAGLGEFGHSGLLITPEFGTRQRIAPIFTEIEIAKPYDREEEFKFIKEFCTKCKKCVKSCPTGAIYDKPIAIDVPNNVYERVVTIHRKMLPIF